MDDRKDRRYRAGLIFCLTRATLYLVFKLVFRIKLFNRENIQDQTVIIFSHHASYLDPMVLGTMYPKYPWQMAKSELYDVFLIGRWIRHLNSFPVRRGTPDRRALKFSLDLLKAGQTLVIFPETTRTADGNFRRLARGASLIAFKSGRKVLPVYINTFEVWPRHRKFPSLFSEIRVYFGKTIDPGTIAGESNAERYDELNRQVLQEWERLREQDRERKGA